MEASPSSAGAVGSLNPVVSEKLTKGPGTVGTAIFGVILVVGVAYVGSHLASDLSGVHLGSALPYMFLAGAFLIALGIEFVNGFHDTANAVATVIYTHSLEPHFAVAWSGASSIFSASYSPAERWHLRSSRSYRSS